ncbi:MAG: glycosyltransferase [Spirochaetaceae bacterium]|jgi:glycosyltransferase involved in cell wall biosynthesis|nr:glycosyltransferase [Spirochaetaceae bacterium]
MITILTHYERISLFHTMEPFFQRLSGGLERRKKLFRLTQSASWCLEKDKNNTLFMERCFQHREPRDLAPEEMELIKKLRDKYKTIVFFCGQGEAGNNRLDLLPYVDRLFYKSVFSDRNNYLRDLYGKNLFADYYHRNYGVCDNPSYTGVLAASPADAERPELSWNIGMGSYPRHHWPQRIGTALARLGFPRLGRRMGISRSGEPEDFSGSRRSIAVHARIDPVSCPSIACQRRLFLDIIAGNPRRDLFLTGLVSQEQYYRELRDSKIVLSPFGWGEVCFRDFEAILSGALLFKPRMSHLKTWPDVYIPYETFVPLEWDGSDLAEQSQKYLENEGERRRMASNAYEQYRRELSGLAERFKNLLGIYL